jgi:hypothetical protein
MIYDIKSRKEYKMIFSEIYEWLKLNYKSKNILENLKNYIKESGEVQETAFRILIKLRCVKSLEKYTYLETKDFNNSGDFKKIDMKDFMEMNIKDKGSVADCIIEYDDKIIIFTSKNGNFGIGDYDLDKIEGIINDYQKKEFSKDKDFRIGIITKCKKELNEKLENSNQSSRKWKVKIKDIIKENLVFDQKDLEKIIRETFYIFENIEKEELIKNDKPKSILNLYFHQLLTVTKTKKLLKETNRVLWGHIPRSGKTYMMAGLIYEVYKEIKNLKLVKNQIEINLM